MVTLYPAINTIYKILYQSECEKFYRIPGKYFDSNIDSRLIYTFCIAIILGICMLPAFMKNYYKKEDNLTKSSLLEVFFLSAIIGFEIGLLNVYNLVEIMKQTYKTNKVFGAVDNWLDKNAYVTITIVIFLCVFTVFGIVFMDNIKHIQHNWIKNMIGLVWGISLTASVLVMLYGTVFKISISLKDKTEYEFVTYGDEEYVVLSSYNDKNLMVSFEIDKKGQYIFKTDQYLFGEQSKGIYQYRNIKDIVIR